MRRRQPTSSRLLMLLAAMAGGDLATPDFSGPLSPPGGRPRAGGGWRTPARKVEHCDDHKPSLMFGATWIVEHVQSTLADMARDPRIVPAPSVPKRLARRGRALRRAVRRGKRKQIIETMFSARVLLEKVWRRRLDLDAEALAISVAVAAEQPTAGAGQ